jgi:hypothetical protein
MGLIVITADKGAPGVTTAAVALAAVWPRPVLLAECDPAGGDIIYRLPAAEGGHLDPRRGLLSLAIATRRGTAPGQVWEHAQKLRGGLDVLVGVANAEQGAGLDLMWDQVGAALAAVPEADVIADCGRLGADGRIYGLLARADAVVLVTRAHLGDLVRLRDRSAAIEAAIRNHGGLPGRLGALVVADHKHFSTATADVRQVLSGAGCPVSLIGGLAHEPRSAEMLSGEWGGKLDKTLLIRTAREIAAHLAGRIQPAEFPSAQPGTAQPGTAQPVTAQPGAGRRGPAPDGPGQSAAGHLTGPPAPAQFMPSQSATAARASGPLPVAPPGQPPPGQPPPGQPPASLAGSQPSDRRAFAPDGHEHRGWDQFGRDRLSREQHGPDQPSDGSALEPPSWAAPPPRGRYGSPEAYAAAPTPTPAAEPVRSPNDAGPLDRTGPLPRTGPMPGLDSVTGPNPAAGRLSVAGPGDPDDSDAEAAEAGPRAWATGSRDQGGWGEGRGRHAGPGAAAGPGGR